MASALSSFLSLCADHQLVSYTTDMGRFVLADTRTGSPEASHDFGAACMTSGLYTHEYGTGFDVLCGFGDANVVVLDLRKLAPRSGWRCWQVSMLGELHRSPTGEFCGMFGVGGFSVWQTDTAAASAVVGTPV